MEIMKYELKYCERCGTLKLRRLASATTYCRPCERLLARFTFPREAGATHSSEVFVPVGLKAPAGIPTTVCGDNLPTRVQ